MRLIVLTICFVVFLVACSTTRNNSEGALNLQQSSKESVPVFSSSDEALAAGRRYLDENKLEEAIEALKQAIKLNPESADAYFQLGIALSLKRDEEQIKGKPEKVSKKSTDIRSGKPVILSEADRAFEMAAKLYKKITEQAPENAEAFFNLGRAYNKIQMDEEAERALRQATKLKPDDSEYQTELGAILIKLAKYEEAIKVLKRAQELDENNLRAGELLEKAEAGKQRISFTMKPKTPKPREANMEENTEDMSEGEQLVNNSESSSDKATEDKGSSDKPTEVNKKP